MEYVVVTGYTIIRYFRENWKMAQLGGAKPSNLRKP